MALTAPVLFAKPAPHVPQGVVSDWTHRHILFPDAKDDSALARIRKDPRWVHSWYLHHTQAWWPEHRRRRGDRGESSRRDWSVSLSATPAKASFDPLFDFSFSINAQAGFGSINTTDELNGGFLATGGSLTVTGANDIGTYSLFPGGPAVTNSPSGAFIFDNLLYPFYSTLNPVIDVDGLLFTNTSGFEVNIWGNGANAYEYDDTGYVHDNTGNPFTLYEAPGAGQTFPAKYVFDVTAAPSCANDFVAIGIPSNPASGGQANIIGYNNLYSSQVVPAPTPAPLCSTVGPTVMFAYASGTGQVPASVVLSQNGSQIAYIENLTTGISYFHVLTIGTTGTNGTSATAAVVPGSAGGNNAVDQTVLLSPDGGVTTQSSTNAPFVAYTGNDANDFAYVTTYSRSGGGSGCLYKINNVFKTGSTPAIVWSIAINAVPSAPVYDEYTKTVFFTDSNGRIDYVVDTGSSPSVVYSGVFATGNTSEYPVIVDVTNNRLYASFDSNGTNAIIVQAPLTIASSVTVPVGSPTVTYAGPYGIAFNEAWRTGVGTPLIYVAGAGTGALPTLYGIGFASGGVLDPSDITSTALATNTADASPVSEFYNANLDKDFLFVGVTNNCVATTSGGTAGCIMSLDVTSGFPTVGAGTTALPATGGTTGIIVDNDSSATEAASIYYATKTGATLVKATQSGLN